MTTSGRVLIAMLLALRLTAPAATPAEDRIEPASAAFLKPEWAVEGAPPPGHMRVAGYLYNSNIQDAANVWLRVDEIKNDGFVSAAHRRRLIGDVRSRGRMAFDVPVSGAAVTYRVVVESVDWLLE